MRTSPCSSLTLSLAAASAILALQATAARADTTKKLIVTLDTPHESAPELFCIVGEQRCSERHCSSLSAIKDAMSFDGASITFDVTALRSEVPNEPLRAALRALSADVASRHDRGRPCRQCAPVVTRVEYMGTPDALQGYVTCARNRRTTGSDRVAVTFLRFHKDNVPGWIGLRLERLVPAGDPARRRRDVQAPRHEPAVPVPMHRRARHARVRAPDAGALRPLRSVEHRRSGGGRRARGPEGV